MTSPPAFQFYVKDWLTSTRGLPLDAKGAHIDLLAWSWENGPVPTAAQQRSVILGISTARERAIWRVIGRRWTKGDCGFTHKRLEREREKQRIYREKQANKGRASAQARLNRGYFPVDARLQPEGNSSSASSSADQIQEDQNHRRPAGDGLDVEKRDIARLVALCQADLLQPLMFRVGARPPEAGPLESALMQAAKAANIPATEDTVHLAVDRALKTWRRAG